MLKKILFLGFTVSILIFSNNLFAEINSVVPLKKPVLSKEEIQKKINDLRTLNVPASTYALLFDLKLRTLEDVIKVDSSKLRSYFPAKKIREIKKLAKKIAYEQEKINKNIKIFLQVNIGDENQKSGINKNEVGQLVSYCREIGLDLVGLMCIPPVNIDPEVHFEEMKLLNRTLGFSELSMGMSSDYLKAVKHLATYVRVGSSIFGQRS